VGGSGGSGDGANDGAIVDAGSGSYGLTILRLDLTSASELPNPDILFGSSDTVFCTLIVELFFPILADDFLLCLAEPTI
jgi:hypothetical protein